MNQEKKPTIHISVMFPDLTKMKQIRKELPNKSMKSFVLKYGKILDLLSENVKIDVIAALIQFYDVPLRCFTFQNFQLAPTLEEFDRILGFSKIKKDVYVGIGQTTKVEDLAKALGISYTNFVPNYKTKGKVQGVKGQYLEDMALAFAKEQEWEACEDCLALLIFGLVLFPNDADYVDPATINVFWAVKVLNVDPTPTLLADVYYAINARYEKGRGALRCCVRLLFSWFMSHLYKDDYLIPNLDKHGWVQKLRALNADSILWYARRLDIRKIAYKCGTFPNIPLIGTRGCINYNPSLALRQLGHPLEDKPSEEELKQLLLHDMGKKDPKILQSIIRAWGKVHKKEYSKNNVVAREAYTQWVINRVQINKLPFDIDPTYKSDVPDPLPMSVEEVEELKASLEKAQREKEGLEHDLYDLNYEKNQLQYELKKKEERIQKNNEQVDKERLKRKRATDGFISANFNLDSHNQQIKDVNLENEKLRGWYTPSIERQEDN
ncbi:uncharacterized protein LOC131654768 [Vicia villosa]|uniref:uncharacterized protein LOC131654768 n=1 Tax=Vicia villosa TaxID=3911 RepID=UPI00273ACBFC|nr:uncharacterized protein LOC131654768 [Vicia villosa]